MEEIIGVFIYFVTIFGANYTQKWKMFKPKKNQPK